MDKYEVVKILIHTQADKRNKELVGESLMGEVLTGKIITGDVLAG